MFVLVYVDFFNQLFMNIPRFDHMLLREYFFFFLIHMYKDISFPLK